VFAAVNPVRQLSSDVVIGGEHLLMPALLGELFATIARVPTFVLSERVERGICLAHSLRVLLIWYVRLDHPGDRLPPNLLRSTAVLKVPRFSTARDRGHECEARPLRREFPSPHKQSEADVAHP
jgi:hypothetical protein